MDYSNEYDMMAKNKYKIYIYQINTDSELDQLIDEKDLSFSKELLERWHEILPEENNEKFFIKCSVDLYER